MTYQLINIFQKKEWESYIAQSIDYDFYHTWHYHSLVNEGTPFLFVYKENDIFIALPLLKRSIEGSRLFDLTSAYGYTGPVSNRPFEYLNERFIENFSSSFIHFMNSGKHVCVFSRLNPFINQQLLLKQLGGIHENGHTVYIDLTVPIEVQRSKYEKRLARKIRQLRNKNFRTVEADSLQQVKDFTKMYTENMLRIGASKRYMYDEDYFSKLLAPSEGNCKLILVYDGTQAICGNIVMYTKSVIRNHLSATATSHVNESPSKLIVDEISIIARKTGLSYYHLGGGLGGSKDSLFQFKYAFSDLVLEDNTWRFVADRNAYEALVNVHNSDKNDSFFPLYRSFN